MGRRNVLQKMYFLISLVDIVLSGCSWKYLRIYKHEKGIFCMPNCRRKTLEENVAMVEKAVCESLLVTEAFFLFQSVLN